MPTRAATVYVRQSGRGKLNRIAAEKYNVTKLPTTLNGHAFSLNNRRPRKYKIAVIPIKTPGTTILIIANSSSLFRLVVNVIP